MADIRIKDLATTATTTASDDFMAVDGTTNGTRKLSANAPSFLGNITSGGVITDQGGTIAAQRNGLAPAQGLAFDGSASIPFTLAATGTNAATFHFCFNPSAASISANGRLLAASTAHQLLLGSSGATFYTVGGSVYSSPLTANTWTVLTLVINGNGTAVIYTNGIAGTSGSITANLSTAWDTIGGLGSADVFSGALRPAFFNRALSAAEVLALYQSGVPASADYNTASNTALNTSAWTNSTGFSTFTSANGASLSAISSGVAAAYTNPAFTFSKGSTIRVYYDLVVNSGATPNLRLSNIGVGDASAVATLTAGTGKYVDVVATVASAGAGAVYLLVGSATNFALTNVSVVRPGLLLAPDSNNAGAGLEWLDVSGNRAHIILPTSGVTWSLPSSQQIVIEASTATNGNQQLGGASLIDANKQWRIQSWTVNCSTGTPTISLGNVSAGTQYNAAAVLAAGNNDITLVTRFPSTANLWVNSNSTATLIHRIVLAPAN